jgi:hypothetical protein
LSYWTSLVPGITARSFFSPLFSAILLFAFQFAFLAPRRARSENA